MLKGTRSSIRILAAACAVGLLLLPLLLLACSSEEPTSRPTREPRERATDASDEREDERTESESQDRSESRGLLGGVTREGSAETDREALEALYEASNGPDWRNSDNWLTDAPLDEWYGITADDDGRVTGIRLYENGLRGEIAPEIGSLGRLVVLDLDSNRLHGAIPPEIGGLAKLEYLMLAGDQLSGDLPQELARISNLIFLVVPGNQIGGKIPLWLTELRNLEDLFLAYNDFSGEIPPELGRMESLLRLELSDNDFTGEIPPELGLLENLVHLGLENNRLLGDIPEELGELTSLSLLGLTGNPQLTGCVPGSLAPQLNPRSDLGSVPICGGLALGDPKAKIEREPTISYSATATPPAKRAPTVTPTPRPTPVPAPTPTPPASAQAQTLDSYAMSNAGGPGAIYVGDLSQLAGPAPAWDLGDRDGNVPLDSLERHYWIYESDHYRSLLAKARITNPTQLTSLGESIEIEFVCLNRLFLSCQLMESFFVSNVLERTDGQVRFQISSFPELGLRGRDTVELMSDGTLSSATIYGGYAAGEIPAFDIQYLWGSLSSGEDSYAAAASMAADLDLLVEWHSDGAVIFSHSLYAGNAAYLFCRDFVGSPRDLQGRRTRSFNSPLSNWINGMGAEAQIAAFAEVYTMLERGISDCAVSYAYTAYDQHWYEVANYIAGPIYNVTEQANVVNRDFWNRIPSDLQQIILEEGAKMELETLRLASIQKRPGFRCYRKRGWNTHPSPATCSN